MTPPITLVRKPTNQETAEEHDSRVAREEKAESPRRRAPPSSGVFDMDPDDELESYFCPRCGLRGNYKRKFVRDHPSTHRKIDASDAKKRGETPAAEEKGGAAGESSKGGASEKAVPDSRAAGKGGKK